VAGLGQGPGKQKKPTFSALGKFGFFASVITLALLDDSGA
jgi:hypothetical protein